MLLRFPHPRRDDRHSIKFQLFYNLHITQYILYQSISLSKSTDIYTVINSLIEKDNECFQISCSVKEIKDSSGTCTIFIIFLSENSLDSKNNYCYI